MGAVLGIVALLLIQGRGHAQEFGKRLRVFCGSAGGERDTTPSTGEEYGFFWIDR